MNEPETEWDYRELALATLHYKSHGFEFKSNSLKKEFEEVSKYFTLCCYLMQSNGTMKEMHNITYEDSGYCFERCVNIVKSMISSQMFSLDNSYQRECDWKYLHTSTKNKFLENK